MKTGMFGSKSTFVPLEGASPEGDAVRVPFETQIKDAPKVDTDQQISSDEVRQERIDVDDQRS